MDTENRQKQHFAKATSALNNWTSLQSPQLHFKRYSEKGSVIAKWENVLAAKSNDLSSIPVKGKTWLPQAVLSATRGLRGMCTHMYTNIGQNSKNKALEYDQSRWLHL